MQKQLNQETEDLLIDYVFERDENEKLNDKYSGFEGIILTLIKNGEVIIPATSDDIEYFLGLFSFIELQPVDSELYKLHHYKLNIDEVIEDNGFGIYVEKEIISRTNEIRSIEKEINDLCNSIGNLKSRTIKVIK